MQKAQYLRDLPQPLALQRIIHTGIGIRDCGFNVTPQEVSQKVNSTL
jgi:hypothetical protein